MIFLKFIKISKKFSTRLKVKNAKIPKSSFGYNSAAYGPIIDCYVPT